MTHKILTPAARRRVIEIVAEIARLRREQARLVRLGMAVLMLLFASAAISEGAVVRTAAENAGGQGRRPCDFPAPPTLAAIPSVTEAAMLGFLITGAGILLAIYQRFNNAKKEFMGEVLERVAAHAAERLEKKEMSIAGQPLQVEGVVRFVAHHELDERLGNYVTSAALHATEQRIDEKLETNFRELDRKRSDNIRDLHAHLTGAVKELSVKVELGDVRTHDRLEAMSTTLRSEFEAKVKDVRGDITELPGRVITLLQQTGQIGQGGKR